MKNIDQITIEKSRVLSADGTGIQAIRNFVSGFETSPLKGCGWLIPRAAMAMAERVFLLDILIFNRSICMYPLTNDLWSV